MTDDATFGAPDPDPSYRNHDEEIAAARKAVSRDDEAFARFYEEFGECFTEDKHALHFAFLSGRMSILKEQRDEYLYAFPGLAE